jgi:hypothetical protein
MGRLNVRLARLEKLTAPAELNVSDRARQAARLLRGTLPGDVDGTLALTAAIYKALAFELPGADVAANYPLPEDRTLLAAWCERCAGQAWPALPSGDDALAVAFLWDWHTGLALTEQWKATGYLSDGEERGQYNEIAERGWRVWEWGGWTFIGLPFDWTDATDAINPNAALVIASLVKVVTS